MCIRDSTIPERRLGAVHARVGQSMPVGNEGAGTVVRAGPDATDLIGKKVAPVSYTHLDVYKRQGWCTDWPTSFT